MPNIDLDFEANPDKVELSDADIEQIEVVSIKIARIEQKIKEKKEGEQGYHMCEDRTQNSTRPKQLLAGPPKLPLICPGILETSSFQTQFQTLSHSKIRLILCLAKEVSERLACKAMPRHFQDLLFPTPFLNSICLCLAKKVSECLAHEATVSLTGFKCWFDSSHHK